MRVAPFAPLALLAASWFAPAAAASPPRLLADPFQDHAVLQRDRPIPVWGRAAPGESITVSLAGHAQESQADADGLWRATLPTMPAGGPHRLEARTRGGVVQTVDDVLIGDVWLCSGQSNMVLQVHRALDSRAEIEGANDPSIRMLTIANDASLVPLTAFKRPVSWQVASKATVPEFSAVCYFFARELRRTVKVPMGLVNASWGSSAISSWMDEESLRALGGQDELLALLADYRTSEEQAYAGWGRLWESWWRARSGDAPGSEPWHTAPDDSWRPVPAFSAWENWAGVGLEDFNGMVWFRTTVMLSDAQAARGATLLLGGIEDVDQAFVNGRPIGNTSEPGVARQYRLPAGTLRAGDNHVVVNVVDTYGTGGMTGPEDVVGLSFDDGTFVPLGSGWLYRAAPTAMGYPPRTPWESTGGMATIGNGMIAPLGAYAFRGVLWYQGEADTDRADSYAARLALLMREWRQRFGEPLSFLVVQLAGWGPPAAAPQDSGFAELREAQRHAVEADTNAALAVAIDIGDRTDIHPANKQEVARRLARAARHLVFGEKVTPSGPRPLSATRAGERVIVRFGDVDGTLVAYSARGPIAFELCSANGAACRFVDARIDGDTVTLDAAGGAAGRVRYCWGDSPVCTLYDGAGLPAVPFELPVTP